MKKMSYTIIEIANTHGGNESYVNELIDSFSKYKAGIKFQPMHPDKLATKDFATYDIYTRLYFNPEQWQSFISKANETKDVWLDLFDDYGIEILERNMSSIHGIKLQVSVLFNFGLLAKLASLDLSHIKLIVNVASLSEEDIEYHYQKIKRTLNVREILIEVGFQAYPTDLADSGLSKIATIKKLFNCNIVFADHLDGASELALWLPILALGAGADCIEKHVMLGDEYKTEFDFYSSLTPDRFDVLMQRVELYNSLMNEPFINDRERLYLEKSILKPILKVNKSKGQGVSLINDLEYKRSGQQGLNAIEIERMIGEHHILSSNVEAGSTLKRYDFKKAHVAVIVAARLKSTRLEKKALLKIGDMASIERCLKNVCSFENVNTVVLATSTLESDAELINYTYNESVVFHRGHPEDVIDRYLDIIDKMGIDIVIRATGDNPFMDNEILQILLKSHFQTGADYTTAREAALGTNLEIINSEALKTIKEHFPVAEYSEYMTWYLTNNAEYFNLNYVDLPKELVRPYRLTLDFDLDLKMFRKIDEELSKNNRDYRLRDVFEFLDNNKEIGRINEKISAKYIADKSLIDTLNEKTKFGNI